MSRFTQAWSDVAKENNFLKVLIFLMAGTSSALAVTVIKLALKEPFMFERGCATKAVAIANAAPTQAEYEAFLKEALPQRFNTDVAVNGDILSLEEIKSRDSEQAELKRREMTERVLVNQVTPNKDGFLVDADRLFSVGPIRSAFSFPLQVKIMSAVRTASNPYGLVLTATQPISSPSEDGKSNGK